MEPAARESDSPQVEGMLAQFSGPEALRAAAAGVRQAGYTRFEAYSPFPIHGIYAAMGRRRTRLPWLVLAGGVAGGIGALALQGWTNAVFYPYEISGKPLFSLPANIPIAFELIVLLSAIAAFAGGLALSGLPELFHPLFACRNFRRVTTDGFFLGIDAADPEFDEVQTGELLRTLGSTGTELYHRPDTQRKPPGILLAAVVVLTALALLPPLSIAKARYKKKASPRVHPVLDMDFQPKYLPQQASPMFADGRSMRPPLAGTIAVDQSVSDEHLLLGKTAGEPATTFPMPVNDELMTRGHQRYDIYCATCHGLAGDGDGITSQLAFEREERGWIKPLSLHNQSVRDQAVGQLFETISQGIRKMPSFRSQVPAEDRWAIVLYIRALQRSRNATIRDVPEHLREHLRQAPSP